MNVRQLKETLDDLVDQGQSETEVMFVTGLGDSPAVSTDHVSKYSLGNVTQITDMLTEDWEAKSVVWLS